MAILSKYLTYKEWKLRLKKLLLQAILILSNLPIMNGNLSFRFFDSIIRRSIVSTLPIRNGNFIFQSG